MFIRHRRGLPGLVILKLDIYATATAEKVLRLHYDEPLEDPLHRRYQQSHA